MGFCYRENLSGIYSHAVEKRSLVIYRLGPPYCICFAAYHMDRGKLSSFGTIKHSRLLISLHSLLNEGVKKEYTFSVKGLLLMIETYIRINHKEQSFFYTHEI